MSDDWPTERGSRLRTAILLYMGSGLIVMGAGSILDPPRHYQPGDIRGDPAFWPTIGAFAVLGGLAFLAAAILYYFRRGPFRDE